jgi:ArsR family transcriptional regulator
LCVNELVDALDMPQSTVSRHLGILRTRGLVSTERRGTSVYYALTDPRIIEALDQLRAILASQLAAEASLTQSLHAD